MFQKDILLSAPNKLKPKEDIPQYSELLELVEHFTQNYTTVQERNVSNIQRVLCWISTYQNNHCVSISD